MSDKKSKVIRKEVRKKVEKVSFADIGKELNLWQRVKVACHYSWRIIRAK